MKKLRPETVFVVEDDDIFLSLITTELTKLNFKEVKTFSTGKSCLENLHTRPDIVLLDYWLEKDLTGIDVLKKIKKAYPHSQAIFLTASDDINIAINSMKHGAYDYIIKGETAFIRLRHLLDKISDENSRKARAKSIIQFQIIVIVMIIIFSILGILFYDYIHG